MKNVFYGMFHKPSGKYISRSNKLTKKLHNLYSEANLKLFLKYHRDNIILEDIVLIKFKKDYCYEDISKFL